MLLTAVSRRIFFSCVALLGTCFSFGQSGMFRGNAEHTGSVSSSHDYFFGDKAWTFNAGAAVRSSVVSSSDAIFFGASNGIFYALNKRTGAVKWQFDSHEAIESSPAYHNGKVFFANNKQSLFCLDAATGRQVWKFDFGTSLPYPWAFDYFYSSPTLSGNRVIIGGKDGYVYAINEADGKSAWKFKTNGIVRSSPAVKDGVVYVGDTEGELYALNLQTGAAIWKFLIEGNKMKNEDFGFDRRAIISSPVVAGDKVLVGARDGFLYAVYKTTGKETWRMDHHVSWVISSVSVQDTVVVTGTSDGHFVQAISLNTGVEMWKYRTLSIVWSSPLIYNNTVYIGSHDNTLYTFDLRTGKRLNSFPTQGSIFTAPVVSDSLLYFGCDDGLMYALKPTAYQYPTKRHIKKFVYWQSGISNYWRNGTDYVIKEFLNPRGYKTVDAKQMATWMSDKDSAVNSVFVFATNYIPEEITAGYDHSPLRTYLNNGGKVVLLGNNPLIFKYDPASHQPVGFNFPFMDSVLSISYPYNDTRSFSGQQPASPTEEGRAWGLRKSWTSALPMPLDKVDIVLGKDENGLAASWVKKYNPANGTGLVQIWVGIDGADDYSFIWKVAEYGL